MKTPVTRLLTENGIAFTLKPHSRLVYTSEEAAQERGVRLAQIVKTMLVKTPDNPCIVALIPGDRQLDLKKLRTVLDIRKLAFISREQVFTITGYEPGAVSPIGMKQIYPIYFDDTILQEEFVDISSGRPDAGVELRSADLLRILVAALVSISKSPDHD